MEKTVAAEHAEEGKAVRDGWEARQVWGAGWSLRAQAGRQRSVGQPGRPVGGSVGRRAGATLRPRVAWSLAQCSWTELVVRAARSPARGPEDTGVQILGLGPRHDSTMNKAVS